MRLQRRVWEMLEAARPGDRAARNVAIFLVVLISLNVIAVVVGSVDAVASRHGRLLYAFEILSVGVFTVEYLARVWSCSADPRFAGLRGRLRYASRPLAVIDLLAILPFYLPLLGLDLRFARVLRLARLAKLGRYSSAAGLLGVVVRDRKEELILVTTMMVGLVIVASCLVYYCENPAQPEGFSSIPAAMWWAVTTLTTVGYGDLTPVTTQGKILASLVAILGVGMFALPAGILGAGFVEELRKRKAEMQSKRPAAQETEEYVRRCPRCGADLTSAPSHGSTVTPAAPPAPCTGPDTEDGVQCRSPYQRQSERGTAKRGSASWFL